MNGEGDWVCAACYYTNFKRRDPCFKCGCPKFASEAIIESHKINKPVLPGDWFCTRMNCGAHNYASRTSCYRCDQSKAPGYLFDPSNIPGFKCGDWICSRCGGHNYASRPECYQCFAPKS